MSNNKGSGTVIPTTNNQPRVTGGVGQVSVNGGIQQGVNIGGGRVQTWDGKIHQN